MNGLLSTVVNTLDEDLLGTLGASGTEAEYIMALEIQLIRNIEKLQKRFNSSPKP